MLHQVTHDKHCRHTLQYTTIGGWFTTHPPTCLLTIQHQHGKRCNGVRRRVEVGAVGEGEQRDHGRRVRVAVRRCLQQRAVLVERPTAAPQQQAGHRGTVRGPHLPSVRHRWCSGIAAQRSLTTTHSGHGRTAVKYSATADALPRSVPRLMAMPKPHTRFSPLQVVQCARFSTTAEYDSSAAVRCGSMSILHCSSVSGSLWRDDINTLDSQ